MPTLFTAQQKYDSGKTISNDWALWYQATLKLLDDTDTMMGRSFQRQEWGGADPVVDADLQPSDPNIGRPLHLSGHQFSDLIKTLPTGLRAFLASNATAGTVEYLLQNVRTDI